MGVGADLHVGAVLALVAEGVHVAHDREGDLALALGQLGARADRDHLVHGGGERDPDAGHVADLRAPDTARDHDVLGLDVPASVTHPADPAVLDLEVGDLDVGHDGQRALGRARSRA